jgi:hypothetical protein
MPIIPLKQRITVKRGGGLDDWGQPLPGEMFDFQARVDEKSEKITDRNGAEVVASIKIYLDKLQDVRYDDIIDYDNELGVLTERSPQKIEVIRDFSGKPVMTVVYL